MSTIRSATVADTPAIIDLAIATEMFLPNEVEPLREVFDNYHAGNLGTDPQLKVWVEDLISLPIGVVYFVPNTMSDRVWELLMIAVDPKHQGLGIGSTLIRFAEQHISTVGGRMLLIDTSSLPKYDLTRAFYRRHGYAEVGCIPDFYKDGDSKVIYAKRIKPKNL